MALVIASGQMPPKRFAPLVLLLLGLALLVLPAGAQVHNPDYQYVSSDPAGSCSNGQPNQYNWVNNKTWGCNNGTWTVSASGAGGVTSITAGTGISVNQATGAVTVTNTAPGASPAGSAGELQTKLTGSTFGGAFVNGSSLPITVLQTDPPSTSISASLAGAGAGNVDNGGHNYVVTFVTATGETSGDTSNACNQMVTVVDKSTNGKVSLTSIPLGGTGVTARKIYRSAANTFFGCFAAQLLTTISDNTTTTYTDNTADSGLGAVYSDQNTAGFGLYGDSIPAGGISLSTFNFTGTPAWTLSAPLILQGGFVASRVSDTDQGYQFNAQAISGSPMLWNNAVFTHGAIAGNKAAVRATTTYFADSVTAFTNKFGAPQFCYDMDFAADAGDGHPFIICSYNGEDGTHTEGGFSTAGGFFCVNCYAAPTGTFRVNGTVYPTRPIVQFQRISMQSGDMAQFLDSDGTTKLTYFDSSGSAQILSDVAHPFIIGKMTASATAPGAGKADLRWLAGTNMGTCKLVSNAGTSATEVTIIDNVGGGC